MNIDTALKRREALEEMTGDETLALAYKLLDEVARLRAISAAQDDLTRELTKHADTMWALLVLIQQIHRLGPEKHRIEDAIAAYQDFTREC